MIEQMKNKPARWLEADGKESEIVLSSRARLARNLKGHRFTHNASSEELEAILSKVRNGVERASTFSRGTFFPMGEISDLERRFLAERHLVSREFLFNSNHRGLVVNEDEDVCLMINEEDHLRMQAFSPGFSLHRAFAAVNSLDDELMSHIGYAFNDRLGFLTACPTNIGTGLRVSVLIHLPGLVHTKEINKLLDSLRKLNHSIRGLYGEGTDVMGNFFQLSNATTLGSSEDEIVNKIKEVVSKVIGFEKRAREVLFSKARSLLEDKIWRAYALMKYSRYVSTKEALSLISAVRLGVGVGIINDLNMRRLNELLIFTQPAHLQLLHGDKMDAQERDTARAEYIRRVLGN